MSFRHKGLEQLYRDGSKRGVQVAHVRKLPRILSALDVAITPADLALPSFRPAAGGAIRMAHPYTGSMVTPSLKADVAAVIDYYAALAPGLIERIADEFARTLLPNEPFPPAGRFLHGDVRRRVPDRFPYLLACRIDRHDGRLPLPAHTRRNPTWMTRTVTNR